MLNKFESLFGYNKRQRNGVLLLLLFIIIFQLVYFFIDFSSEIKPRIEPNKLAMFYKEIDSLEKLSEVELQPKIYPFNPNYITDFKGAQLGMSVEEIDRLLEFRKSGAFINSVQQFKEVTKVSDSLLLKISAFFKFPSWKSNQYSTVKSTSKIKIAKKGDLNKVTEEDLIKVNGVGPTLAARIITYREKLKGYSENNQIYEVYNLDELTANKVIERFEVIEIPIIEKINVNSATFKEVLSIVYIDYELTKLIFQYKNKVGKIQSIDELKKIDKFPLEKFNRIALYLQAN